MAIAIDVDSDVAFGIGGWSDYLTIVVGMDYHPLGG